jgi:polysaccharide export outer membrane protein
MRIAFLTCLLLVSACTSMPKSGPDSSAITGKAVHYAAADANRPLEDYFVLDISDSVVSYFDTPRVDTFGSTFGTHGGGAPGLVLGVGDVIQVTLFESSAGGLFIPAEAGSRAGNFVTLPNQTINSTGLITVPYAGQIRVAGQTAAQVEEAINAKLADRAIEPQAVVTLVTSKANEVSVLGDVNTPSKFPLNEGGERVLDVISRAGGVSTPERETYVTLQRGGRAATMSFGPLLTSPKQNIFVRPGDIIYVNRERRTFVAVGAAGVNGRIDFEESNLTLADAIGKAGGLVDDRADPARVFLYRLVPAETAARVGLPVDVKGRELVPVIFRLNMRDPGALFIARKFAMQDRDILYIDNADAVEFIKVLDVINSATEPVRTAADIADLSD